MDNRPVFEFLLKLINLLLTLSGLSLLILGVYCLIKWKQNSHKTHLDSELEPTLQASLAVDHSARVIYLFLAIGTMLFLISCLGFLGTTVKKPCCLSFYSVLLFGLVLAELIVAAFLLFDQSLGEDLLHVEKTRNPHSIYHFIHAKWKIIRWVVLVALILEVIALVLALYLRSMNRAVYDSSDDEIILISGSQQAITDKRSTPATGTSPAVGHGQEKLVII